MTETPVRVSPAPVTSVKGSELNEDASYRPYGATTFASCPIGTIETIRAGEAVVLGVPYERTKISRPGASEGPKAIREATAMFGFAVESMAGGVIADLDSGVTSRYRPRLRDLGNLDVEDLAVEDMHAAVRGAVGRIASRGALPVILGGDHYVTFPSISGVVDAREHEGNVGYLHFDMHLDMAGEIPYWGIHSCGAVVRRVVDAGIVDPKRITVIGAESFQHQNEVDFAREHGITINTVKDVRARGAGAVVKEAAERALSGADALYVSVDIDCLMRTYAPGTGNVVGISGLFPDELMEGIISLRSFPVVAFDMTEVAPRWDPTGRTPAIASTMLLEFLRDHLFVGGE
jgi:agmatinase